MNLFILYPHFMQRGMVYQFLTGASLHEHKNLYSGSRQLFFRRSTTGNSITFRINATSLKAEQRNINFVYCAGLNLITSYSTVGFTLKGADDTAISANVNTQTPSGVTTSNLQGRNREDYVYEFSSDVYRDYWEVVLNTTTSNLFNLRKLYAGQMFHFGVEPDAPVTFTSNPDTNKRLNIRSFSLQWVGVTNEKLRLFTENILHYYQFNPVVLYARTWDGVLNNEKLIHCKINEYSMERITTNNNRVRLTFDELI